MIDDMRVVLSICNIYIEAEARGEVPGKLEGLYVESWSAGGIYI